MTITDFEPAAAVRENPLAGFKVATPYGRTRVGDLEGFAVRNSGSYLSFSNEALRYLMTKNVEILFDVKSKQMAVVATDSRNPNAIPLIKNGGQTRKAKCVTISKSIRNLFSLTKGVDIKKYRYVFDGEKIGNSHRTLVFDLSAPSQVKEAR